MNKNSDSFSSSSSSSISTISSPEYKIVSSATFRPASEMNHSNENDLKGGGFLQELANQATRQLENEKSLMSQIPQLKPAAPLSILQPELYPIPRCFTSSSWNAIVGAFRSYLLDVENRWISTQENNSKIDTDVKYVFVPAFSMYMEPVHVSRLVLDALEVKNIEELGYFVGAHVRDANNIPIFVIEIKMSNLLKVLDGYRSREEAKIKEATKKLSHKPAAAPVQEEKRKRGRPPKFRLDSFQTNPSRENENPDEEGREILKVKAEELKNTAPGCVLVRLPKSVADKAIFIPASQVNNPKAYLHVLKADETHFKSERVLKQMQSNRISNRFLHPYHFYLFFRCWLFDNTTCPESMYQLTFDAFYAAAKEVFSEYYKDYPNNVKGIFHGIKLRLRNRHPEIPFIERSLSKEILIVYEENKGSMFPSSCAEFDLTEDGGEDEENDWEDQESKPAKKKIKRKTSNDLTAHNNKKSKSKKPQRTDSKQKLSRKEGEEDQVEDCEQDEEEEDKLNTASENESDEE